MSKYTIIHSKQYKKAIKKFDNKALQEVQAIVEKLANGEILEEKYKDHKLKGVKCKEFKSKKNGESGVDSANMPFWVD